MGTHSHPLAPRPEGHAVAVACAAPSWDGVVQSLCGHRADLGPRLTAYLDAHPSDVAALCLSGFTQLLPGRADRLAAAAAAETAARDALTAAGGGSARDRGLLSALRAWRDDRPFAAAAAFDRILADEPRDLLAIKLQHSLLLMTGAPARMRRSLERVLPAWSGHDEETGFVLGCYAFSLEETGEFARAESVGRRAVALQPVDAWGIHAVTHVFESLGRAREGLAWLAQHEPGYAGCNGFLGHVHWHRALLHFQLEEFARVLDIFDRHVATPWVGDYRDMANAVSLLWRLESEGVDVGRRWQALARIAAERAADHRSAFGLAHYVAALAHGGAPDDLARALDLLPATARAGCARGSQEAAVADVARPLCQGIAALQSGDAAAAYAVLATLEPELARIGGSNAQRDLFVLMFIDSALAAGETEAARRAIAARQRLRPHDRWLSARASGSERRAPVVMRDWRDAPQEAAE